MGSEGTSDFDEVARELIAMYHCSVKSLLQLLAVSVNYPGMDGLAMKKRSLMSAHQRAFCRGLVESYACSTLGAFSVFTC